MVSIGMLIRKMKSTGRSIEASEKAMTKTMIAGELVRLARELVGMDFPTRDAMDKYLKQHPDADRSKHRVVPHDPSDMNTHPFNLMRQRKNEKALAQIGKHYKKDPKDLTVDEIERYNRRRAR